MSKLKSLRIPDSIHRQIQAIADRKKITLTDAMLRLIRTGLQHENELDKNRTSLAEIQSQQAFWDGKLLGMADDLGVDLNSNLEFTDSEEDQWIQQMIRDGEEAERELAEMMGLI